ncbi:unnamed protein product [Mytilus coruscus]|uniref:Tudor domain-containing protein n=1 Tax=Mytilus coruscus TaxID=42192 RepID=A0A6J8EIN2_MYTCO|nr:unnamed protein product [Mytilus coruscus]
MNHLKEFSCSSSSMQSSILEEVIKSFDWKHFKDGCQEKLKEELSQRAEENTVLSEKVGSGQRTIKAQFEEIKNLKEKNKSLVERLKEKSSNTDQLAAEIVLLKKQKQDLEENVKCQSQTTAICLTQELPDINEETTIMKNLDVPEIESIERDFLQDQCSKEIEGEEEVADQIEKKDKRGSKPQLAQKSRKRKNDATLQVEIVKDSKERTTLRNTEELFEVSEKVTAYWKPAQKWYPAKILEITKRGYKVIFDDKLVRVLKVTEIKKIKNRRLPDLE